MLGQIYTAHRGGRLWNRLARKYKVDQGIYVLLMPEDDPELNAAALAHLDDLKEDRHARGVVLVGDRALPRSTWAEPGGLPGDRPRTLEVVGTEAWTADQIDALLRFYELDNAFTNRLLVVSLTKPFGNGLYRLLDRQGVTKEDLVCLGCLRLRGYGMQPA